MTQFSAQVYIILKLDLIFCSINTFKCMKILKLITFLFLISSAYAQEIEVSAKISKTRYLNGKRNIEIDTEVKNITSHSVSIYYMSCSVSDSWELTGNKLIKLQTEQCDKNFPQIASLKQNQVKKFKLNASVDDHLTNKNMSNLKFKVGFKYTNDIVTTSKHLDYITFKAVQASSKLYESNELEIPTQFLDLHKVD